MYAKSECRIALGHVIFSVCISVALWFQFFFLGILCTQTLDVYTHTHTHMVDTHSILSISRKYYFWPCRPNRYRTDAHTHGHWMWSNILQKNFYRVIWLRFFVCVCGAFLFCLFVFMWMGINWRSDLNVSIAIAKVVFHMPCKSNIFRMSNETNNIPFGWNALYM